VTLVLTLVEASGLEFCSTSVSSMTASTDVYLALIPRGLEHVARELIVASLSASSAWIVHVRFRGEEDEPSATRTRDLALEKVATRILETDSLSRLRRSGSGSRPALDAVVSSTCSRPVGVVKVDASREVAVGYYRRRGVVKDDVESTAPLDDPALVWSEPGQLKGLVWVQISTTAPVEHVAVTLRCLGSLLVLVHVWDANDNETPNGFGGGAYQTLEEAACAVRDLIERRQAEYGEAFRRALNVWCECAKRSWDLPEAEERALRERMTGTSEPPFRYRISCLRENSKRYAYSRQQFLERVADSVVPFEAFSPSRTWRVDMTNYDVEIVVLVRSAAVAIGLAARPYQRLSAKSFSAGVVPPDVSPPYLSGTVLSGLVRLRPSTTQLLLHLARLRPGDVLFDPCAGIGTIPVETMLPGAVPVIAMGGDLVLTTAGLGSVASSYAAEARTCQKHWYPRGAKSTVAEFLVADAASLPLRDESVDAVVSDLPFGQLCLSSAKLAGMVPLLVSELARVLRRGSGRVVLLCGSYTAILSAMRDENERSGQAVWQLPCQAVFPVNIGGFQGWVIQVRRDWGDSTRLANHSERVRKITNIRNMKSSSTSRSETSAVRRLQS
jgi:tRNA G10  N-methylase Trm11